MRTIKFRGKRLDNGEWVYGSLIIDTTEKQRCWIIDYAVSENNVYDWSGVDPKTVGQYIGLPDKNGVEIYDGSTLKDPKGQYGKVFYSEKEAAFKVNWKMKDGSWETDSCIGYGEVVGDIHSDPLEVPDDH